ncbi:MAG: hypothetical protein ACRD2N_13660 [Vicinamibacterales bacterium]
MPLHRWIVISLLFGDSFIHAQITNGPTGHWEGTITMPFGELRFEIDLDQRPRAAVRDDRRPLRRDWDSP